MKVKYVIKYLIPTITALALAASCDKPEPEQQHQQQQQPKPQPQPQPHHNTTYIWGVDNWASIWPASKVAASADSTLVDNVYLKNDGVNMNGMLARDVYDRLNKVIESVSSANRAKVHGYGTLNGTGIMDEADVQDSTKLSKLGFYFANTKHQHNTTYVWGKYYWDAVWPADNVAKSADSTWVKNVILKNDGASFEGWSTTRILKNMDNIINCVAPEKQNKIRGLGKLNDVAVTNDQEWQDSVKLAKMGFTFGYVYNNGYKHTK